MRRQGGFTLIELMIALVLMSMVVGGLTSMVLSAGRAQANSNRISVAQGGVRAALEFLTRDVMSVSAGAATGTIVNGSLLALTAQPLPIMVLNSTTGPDRLDLILIDPTVWLQTAAAYNNGDTTITLGPPGANPFSTGTIQICNLSNATLLTANSTGFDGTGFPTLTVNPNTNPLPVPSYPAGAWVFKSRIVSYYVTTTIISVNPPTAYPVFMMDPDGPGPAPAEPLAEGIEDFQVALGIDFNGDGVIDPVESPIAGGDEWVFNVPGETMPATLAGLKTVRITLVARTTSTDVGLRGQAPDAEDHPGGATPDAYPRRVVRSEITVRNFNL